MHGMVGRSAFADFATQQPSLRGKDIGVDFDDVIISDLFEEPVRRD